MSRLSLRFRSFVGIVRRVVVRKVRFRWFRFLLTFAKNRILLLLLFLVCVCWPCSVAFGIGPNIGPRHESSSPFSIHLLDPFRSPIRRDATNRKITPSVGNSGRSRLKGCGLELVRSRFFLGCCSSQLEIQRVPRGRLSCANPKTPGGVHVTGPPSRVPLWLAPIVLVTVRVPRSAQSNVSSV